MTPRGRVVKALTESEIAERIYTIRGKKVMLDRDLAKIYGVPTKRLNEQVRRNLERFPEDFMFILSKVESEASRSQNATLNRGKNIKYLPYAFTFKGISMLSSVLRSKLAIQRNIYIMRVFEQAQELKTEAASLHDKFKLIEHQVSGDKHRLDVAFDAINFLLDNKRKK